MRLAVVHQARERLLTRLVVAVMAAAVLCLGAMTVWATLVTRDQASGLSRAGVQITGQLRAVQAVYLIHTQLDALEEEVTDDGRARLRAAVAVVPVELGRMADGESVEAVAAAARAQPLAAELAVAVETLLADPRSDLFAPDGEGDDTSEDALEEVLDELEAVLNDSGSDPARLLTQRLDTASGAALALRRGAGVLVPVGLGAVLVCGWLLGSFRRRSEAAMQQAMDRSAQDARTDQLTGLPNRRGVLEELDRRLAGDVAFIFALADLNGFKQYNDTFGHPAGDELLRRLGERLATSWAGLGYAARLGGDEFCVIAEGISPDRLQALLREALSEAADGFSISAESGLAHVPAEAGDASAVLTLADARLYDAKARFHLAAGTARGRAPSASSLSAAAHWPAAADRRR